MQIVLIGIYMMLTVSGLVLIKLGGTGTSVAIQSNILIANVNLLLILGLLCYVCSFVMFTVIVQKYELGYIFPIVSGIVNVLAVIAGIIFLKESINVYGIVGIAAVVLGIVLMNIKR